MQFSARSLRTWLFLCIAPAILIIACSAPDGIILSPGSTTYKLIDLTNGFSGEGDNLKTGEVSTDSEVGIKIVKLFGTIESDLVLEADHKYYIEGTVFVGKDTAREAGNESKLTIQKGTEIYGGPNSALIVRRGSKLVAVGDKDEPIVFSSFNELLRQQQHRAAPKDQRSEWRGLVLNGQANINNCAEILNANKNFCQNGKESTSGEYGGFFNDDNSGSLEFVRIEYAGMKQSKGITFQGVGAGTNVSNIQVHYSGDDAIKFVGGTVSATNVVVTDAFEDSIVWTDGWQGTLQNLLVIQNKDEGKKLLEGTSQLEDDLLKTPRSKPKIANFTLIGNKQDAGVLLSKGTGAELYNGIVVDTEVGIEFGDNQTFKLLETPHHADRGKISIDSLMLNNDKSARVTDSTMESSIITKNFGPIAENVNIDRNNFLPGPYVLPIPKLVNGQMLYMGSDNREYTENSRPPGVTLNSTPVTVQAALGKLPLTDLSSKKGLVNKEFVGAFSPKEKPTDNWTIGWTKNGTIFNEFPVNTTACPAGTKLGGQVNNNYIVCEISGGIIKDLTLKDIPNVYYKLNGLVFIGEDGGPSISNKNDSVQVTLTIEPGVTIFGNSQNDGLVVTRGSKIIAEGTREKPIIMTSGDAVLGLADYTNDSAKWLGLTINGKARINNCNANNSESNNNGGRDICQKEGEASTGEYGGSLDSDNSGSLKYVRVEFAGVHFDEESQSNGIAFQGVGSGTTVEHIQVHNNGDDGIEFFGGTVNAKYIVITGAGDDSIDWTDGWRGNLQFLIIEQKQGNDLAFEGDNFNEPDPEVLPQSSPDITNFTILGTGSKGGIKLREGTAGRFVNGIIINKKFGIDIDDDSKHSGGSYTELQNGKLVLKSLIIDSDQPFVDESSKGEEFTAKHVENRVENLKTSKTTLAGGNTFYENNTKQGFIPGPMEKQVLAFDPTKLNEGDEIFFEQGKYVGAVKDGNDNWYLGWTVNHTGKTTKQ